MRQKDGKVDQKLNTKLNNFKNNYIYYIKFHGICAKRKFVGMK